MNDRERPVGSPGGGRRVFILHGYGSGPGKHWFPWFRARLEEAGCCVDVVPLPDAGCPVLVDWLACLQEHVGTVDENTFFVAHSLGCVALLGFLQTLDEESRFGGMILVSGFSRSVEGLRELDAFATQCLDFDRLAAMSGRTEVIAAADDPVVPAAATEELAARLHAGFVLCEHGGHFMDSDGFQEWPFLLDRVEKMLASSC